MPAPVLGEGAVERLEVKLFQGIVTTEGTTPRAADGAGWVPCSESIAERTAHCAGSPAPRIGTEWGADRTVAAPDRHPIAGAASSRTAATARKATDHLGPRLLIPITQPGA